MNEQQKPTSLQELLETLDPHRDAKLWGEVIKAMDAQNVSAALPEPHGYVIDGKQYLTPSSSWLGHFIGRDGCVELVRLDTVAPVYAERDALKARVAELEQSNQGDHAGWQAERETLREEKRQLEALLAKGKEVLPERIPYPTLKGGTDPVSIAYDVASGFNACLDACTPVVADMAARIAELEAEVGRLSRLIDQHYKALDRVNAMWRRNFEKATGGPYPIPALSADEEFDQIKAERDTLRTKNAELVGLLGDLKGKTILSWADKHRISALADSPNTPA